MMPPDEDDRDLIGVSRQRDRLPAGWPWLSSHTLRTSHRGEGKGRRHHPMHSALTGGTAVPIAGIGSWGAPSGKRIVR